MGPDAPLLSKPVQGQHSEIKPESSKSPLVSVIIPTRNSERTIRSCLESVRSQTYRSVEIIIVSASLRSSMIAATTEIVYAGT